MATARLTSDQQPDPYSGDCYVVLHHLVGQYRQGAVVPASLLGPDIDRLVALEAIRPATVEEADRARGERPAGPESIGAATASVPTPAAGTPTSVQGAPPAQPPTASTTGSR